jgi:hypothetical protein
MVESFETQPECAKDAGKTEAIVVLELCKDGDVEGLFGFLQNKDQWFSE